MGAYSQAVAAASSLQAYLRLNESSGTALADQLAAHGMTASNVTLGGTAMLSGDAGTSATFGGTNSEAALANSSELDIANGSTPWACEALVRPNITRSGGDTEYTVYSKMLSSGTFRGMDCQIAWVSGSSKCVIQAYFISDFGGGTWVKVTGTTDLSNATVYHLAWESDGTYIYLFVNGVLDAFSAIGFATTTSTAVVGRLGSRNGASNWYKGGIQEFAFYSGTAINGGRWLGHYLLSLGRTQVTIPSTPAVILLTDLANDVDDVGDMGVLCALANRGSCSIAAVVTDSANLYSSPTAKAILNYYGQSSVPVGAWKGSNPSGTPSTSVYTEGIRDRFRAGETRADYSDSLTILRQALHDATDGTVVLVATGFATALVELMNSAADGIDARSGADLITAKVAALVAVAGIMPTGTEWNMVNDPQNYHDLFVSWPTQIVVTGIELIGIADPYTIVSGPPSGDDPLVSPVKYGFDLFAPTDNTPPDGQRAAWGQLGLLFGVRGLTTYFEYYGIKGSQTVNNTTGVNTWAATSGNVSYLGLNAAAATVETELLDLLDDAPPSGPTFAASPSTIPKNHSGSITITLTGTDTAWDGTTVFSLSGVAGVTKISQSVASATSATVVLTTGSTTGTLTITESVTGTATVTVTVATASISLGTTSGLLNTTPSVTITGTNTIWNTETAATLLSISGGSGASLGTPTINSATSVTVTITGGSGTGTLTITDNSTGATANFTVAAATLFYARPSPTARASINIAKTFTVWANGSTTATVTGHVNADGSFAGTVALAGTTEKTLSLTMTDFASSPYSVTFTDSASLTDPSAITLIVTEFPNTDSGARMRRLLRP